MSTFLSETLGVADSGVMWDVGNFKLFQSTRPNIVLFITKRPQIIQTDGRYAMAVSVFREQQGDGSIKITGGSSMFSITSAIQFDPKAFNDAKASWVAAMGSSAPRNVQFVPLNVQKGEATVLINPQSGVPDKAHNDKDVGTPGGTLSFLCELTALGAQEWEQAIKQKTAIPGGVKFMYEYLRMMPDVGSEVIVHGDRAFQHLSMALDVSVDGFWYGGSAKIDAEWEKMVKNGSVEITFIGGGLPPDLEKMRQDLTMSFAAQAKEMLFKDIFAPKPDVKPAQAGNTHGVFGGANYAMKYKSEKEFLDLTQTIRFKGMTWLKASMDTDFMDLFSRLDDSYVTEVATQQAFDSSVVIDGDPILSDVTLSMSWKAPDGLGRSPVAPVFTKDGGNQRYTVNSRVPNDVIVNYDAKINYAAARWPIVPVKGSVKVSDGGNQIVIKPASWVGRHQIFMFVRDGDKIVPPTDLTEDDYLILNVSYSAPFLKDTIRDSAHLSGLEMVEFSYPTDPLGTKGVAKFSAFGVIGGKLVRATDQVIDPDETAVFILATRGGTIQLVSKNSPLPEDDRLAQDLLNGQARPVVSGAKGTAPDTETTKAGAADGPAGGYGDGKGYGVGDGKGYGVGVKAGKGNGTGSAVGEVVGRTVGVEFSGDGAALWILNAAGQRVRVRLQDPKEAMAFETASKNVRIKLDGDHAKNILIELPSC